MEPQELTRRRTALGLSRPNLAREVGVSAATVWRWEVEARKPTAIIGRQLEQTLTRLECSRSVGAIAADALGVPLSQIVVLKGDHAE